MNRTLLKPENVCLHVVDVQASLMAKIAGKQVVEDNIALLIKCFKIMDVPIVASTQYKRGLGSYVEQIEKLVEGIPQFDKVTFGAAGDGDTLSHLQGLKPGVQTVVLVGVESHICVYQTALGLLAQDFNVWIVSDAVSSRNREDHDVAMRRMETLGISIGSTEMLIYELLGKAGSPQFKAILPYIVERDKKE